MNRQALVRFALAVTTVFFLSDRMKISAQTVINVAPMPSARFLASWYPPDNNATYTTEPDLGSPYTATLIVYPSPRSPGSIASSRTLQARDSAGRTRTEEFLSGAAGGSASGTVGARRIEVNDPVSHCSFNWIEPAAAPDELVAGVSCMPKTVHYSRGGKWADAIKTQATVESPFPNQVIRTEPLGEKVINGLRALGVRRTITNTDLQGNAANSLIAEMWFSPELKELLQLSTNQAQSPSFELADIHRDEPDPSIFYPPANYRIVSQTDLSH